MSIKQNLYNLWCHHKIFIIIILILLVLNSIFIALYVEKEKFTENDMTGGGLSGLQKGLIVGASVLFVGGVIAYILDEEAVRAARAAILARRQRQSEQRVRDGYRP